MDLKGEVAELIREVQSLIGEVQSCAAGLDEWPLEYYSKEDRDRIADARDKLKEVLQQIASKFSN